MHIYIIQVQITHNLCPTIFCCCNFSCFACNQFISLTTEKINNQCTFIIIIHISAGASSQCYWDELMLLKWELILLKCQINTNRNKNGFLLPSKCLEGALKYSYLDSIIYYLCLRIFQVKFVTFTRIVLNEEDWYVSEKKCFAWIEILGGDVIIFSIIFCFINYSFNNLKNSAKINKSFY